MALRDIVNQAGHWLKGQLFKVDQEIEFEIKSAPRIKTIWGGFVWDIIPGALQAWIINDGTVNVVEVDSLGKKLIIDPSYQGVGFYGIDSAVATTDATPTEVEKIDTLTDNSVHLVELKVTAISDTYSEWGTWHLILSVTKVAGVPVIQQTDTIAHASSAGLSAVSVTSAVNGGDIDIDVTGIAATNIQWNSQYEIITKSTN